MVIKKIKRFFKCLGFLLSISLTVILVLMVAFYGFYRNDIPKVLTVNDYRPNLKTKVFAQSGELIAEFGVHERIIADKEELLPLIRQAFLASEDKNFYRHHGIDFFGIASAILQSISGRRSTLRGASTITQQLAKSLLIKKEGQKKTTARSFSRKVKEAILARRLELHLSKEDILWMYLNEVYLGHGSYGVAAAAWSYFRKDLKNLTLPEIAILAGLPQAPSRFSPQVNLLAALSRQAYVLSRMLDEGYITQEQHDEALTDNKNLKVFDRKNHFRTLAPYFSETIRRVLIEKFGEQRVYEDGFNVYTTLNMDHEISMQYVLKNGLINTDKRQGFLGPIFHPTNIREKNIASRLIQEMNENYFSGLEQGFFLAQVDSVDNNLNAIFISLGQKKGVIPLSGMVWARSRDPNANYRWHKLRKVTGILNAGDVVMVRKRTFKELKEIDTSSDQHELVSLQNYLTDKLNKLELFSLEQEPMVEGAMLAMEPNSGYITAMSGGYSFDRSEFNRVYQACRQPGSLFKPIVYSAAIALKKYTPATMVMDTPLTFNNINNESSWKPKNFGNNYAGEVTVHEAVMRSMNVPTLNVMADVGVKNVLDFAKSLGVTTELKTELGTAIGSSCVTPWELAQVFAIIANLGVFVEPILIREITDRAHQRIQFQAKKDDPFIGRSDRMALIFNDVLVEKKQVLKKEDAFTMHYLLTETAKHGTAQGTRVLNRHLAGKTGTTNDSFDTWFAGYTKNLLSLVWVGNDTMETPLGGYEQGARTALPLFNNFMELALNNLTDERIEMPSTMCEARIDSKTGLRIENYHPLSFVAPFRCGEEPPLKTITHQNLEQAMEIMGGM
jgi:penicillin-binding protein 1A